MYPILVWYTNRMATDGGGGEMDGRQRHFGPWFKSPPGYNLFLLIFMLLLF